MKHAALPRALCPLEAFLPPPNPTHPLPCSPGASTLHPAMLAMLRSPSLLPPKPDSLSARLRQPFGPQHLRVTHRAGPTGQQPALGLGTGLGTALEPCMLPWGGGAGCSKEGRRQPCVGTARGPVPPPRGAGSPMGPSGWVLPGLAGSWMRSRGQLG